MRSTRPKVPQQRRLGVGGIEARLEWSRTGQLVELAEMIRPVGRRNEPSTGSKDARELPQRAVEVFDVEEHPGGDRAIERLVVELEGLRVADTGIDAPRPGELDHALGLVDGNHLGPELARHPLGELSLAAAHLEDTTRPSIPDRSEHDLARVGALSGRVRSLSRRQLRLVRVLLADELGIVEPHGSTIGVPGIPRRGAFPPSHAFTVAPTSANSPSWTWPAALRPST